MTGWVLISVNVRAHSNESSCGCDGIKIPVCLEGRRLLEIKPKDPFQISAPFSPIREHILRSLLLS